MVEEQIDRTKEEGPIWVASNGLIWVEKPTLTWKETVALRENYYWATLRNNLSTLVYRERYTLEVLDKIGNPDPTPTALLKGMCNRPEVDLWSRMMMVFPDWYDWGISLLNPVWDYEGGTYALQKLKRIPPELFGNRSINSLWVYSEILQGINLDKDNQVEFCITLPNTSEQKILTNIFAVRDPTVPELAGKPMIRPVVSIIRMLDFAWGAQMQRINRIGAPILFIRMAKWTEDDIAYAQAILNNWGKDTSYQLRPGMELVDLKITDSTTAAETIAILADMVVDAFASSKLIAKDGTLLGGSSAPELDITYAFISGFHRKLESQIEALLQPFCAANGYPDHQVKIHIPSPSIDRSALDLERAKEGRAARTISPQEHRKLIGEETATDDEIDQYADWWDLHEGTPMPAFPAAGLTNKSPSYDETAHQRIAATTRADLEKIMSKFQARVIAAVEDHA